MSESEKPKVLICGAGVIGASIAYHLALKDVRCELVDRSGVASAASGKAGGFLALDWNDGSPLGPLARLSFQMHEDLASTLELSSYRRMTCEAVSVEGGPKPKSKKLSHVEWVDLGVRGSRVMGTEDTVAQVHPKHFTEGLLHAARERCGTSVRVGEVQAICLDADMRVTGVKIDGEVEPADVVVVAMGPWSARVEGVHVPPVLGQKYHSVLMRPGRTLSQAVFFQGYGDPEVYPRPDGDVYVTGFPDQPAEVTEVPGQVEVREEVCTRLIDTVRKVSSEFQSAEVTVKQSCHLPITLDGMPMMGKLPLIQGGYIATGHSCWGILNAPATGAAMAELIVNGTATCVDISAFDPVRFYNA